MGPIPGGWVDRRVDYISQVCLGAAHVVAGPDFGPLLDCESKGRVQLAVGVVRKTTGGGESKGGAKPSVVYVCHHPGSQFFREWDVAFRAGAEKFLTVD